MLKYLAPYVYRVAISDNRIVSVDDQGVTYKVKPSGKRHYQTRWLDGESFSSFAQHILPPGFQKIRYYGFMSPNCKLQLADVRWLLWLWRGWTFWLGSAMVQEPRRRHYSSLEVFPLRRRSGVGGLDRLRGPLAVASPVWQRGPPENIPEDHPQRGEQVRA